MKSSIIFLLLIFLLFSCNNSTDTQAAAATDSVTTANVDTASTKIDTAKKAADTTSILVKVSKFEAYKDEGNINLGDSANSLTISIHEIKTAPTKEQLRAILKLRRIRYLECEKGKIIKKATRYKFELNGLDVFIQNQKIAGIGSLNLTPVTLAAVTQKVVIIDGMLYENCVDLGREYARLNPSEKIIVMLLEAKKELYGKLIDLMEKLKEADVNNASDETVKKKIDSVKVKK